MNKMQFDYITSNKLYNSNDQGAFIQKQNIALPVGSIELKAAWKILTPGEIASGRFHTTRAYIAGLLQPVTVGLVGLHVFNRRRRQRHRAMGHVCACRQCAGAAAGPVPGKTTPSSIQAAPAVRLNSKATKPTQVVQQTPDDPTADQTTKDAWKIIGEYSKQKQRDQVAVDELQAGQCAVVAAHGRAQDAGADQASAAAGHAQHPADGQRRAGDLHAADGCELRAMPRANASSAADSSVGSGYSFMFGYASAPSQ
jgi:hypothetical protein